MTRLIRRIRAFLRPRPMPVDAMIARRALRLHNRRRDMAARYERVHTILAEGRR
jgi:hypothetical protein